MWRVRIGVLALVTATLLAGCGAGQTAAREGEESTGPGAEWARATSQAGSSRIAISHDDASREPGLYDYAREVGVIGAGTATDQLQIFTPGATYVRFLNSFDVDLGSQKWLNTGRVSAPLEPFGGTPTDLLRLLMVVDDAKWFATGHERDVAVNWYRLTVDVERALGQFAETDREEVRRLFSKYWADSDRAGIAIEVAVDNEARLRAVRSTVYGDDAIRLLVEFFDYGVSVEVEAPPGEEVITTSEYDKLVREKIKSREES